MKIKTLVFGTGRYVDPGRLHLGLYEQSMPSVYPIDTEMEKYQESICDILEGMHMGTKQSEVFKENLSKCRFIELGLYEVRENKVKLDYSSKMLFDELKILERCWEKSIKNFKEGEINLELHETHRKNILPKIENLKQSLVKLGHSFDSE